MPVINVSAGSQAVVHLAAANAATANSSVDALVLPQMQL